MTSDKKMRTKSNKKILTKDENGNSNGFLIPIYNVNDGFHDKDKEPQQVYLTVVSGRTTKGPHLHHIRTGFFTCIKGNIKVVVKEGGKYNEYFSGEDYEYCSIIIETGHPALIVNLTDEDAYILNMPSPAWTPTMNDEFTADFSDYKKLQNESNH